VTFIPFDGTMSWQSGDETVEATFSDAVSSDQRARRYRTAISTDLEGALPKILRDAHRRLLGLRESSHPEAGGLVVAADGEHARAVGAALHQITGVKPVIVMHTDPQAHRKLEAFTHATDPWIVAVNMVSEGVDIPRLRIGVYATAAKTAMIFRQIVGRFVRTIPDRPVESAWLYMPAEPTLRAHAAEIDSELIPLLRRKEDVDPDAMEAQFDEPATKAEDEMGLAPEFKALNADMAPEAQLDLFGGATPIRRDVTATPMAMAGGTGAPPPAGGGAAVPGAVSEVPLWQQRQRLRETRHRLVSELGRSRRATQREINAWVNKQIGIAKVQDASIEQLQQSIDLLERALLGRA
jgi:hypothetical protein